MDEMVILAADVGGTKTYLALYRPESCGFQPVAEARYTTAEYPSLGRLLQSFVEESGKHPKRVVVGVPGPVRQLPVRAVNLPWKIHPDEIRATLQLDRVTLLNDLEATAYGTQALHPEDMVVLNEGVADREGNVAVIAAGTGLGEGGLCWTGDRYTAIASEGGHATFAPSNKVEGELWGYLAQRFGHVSWERVVSGPGLGAIYDFLRDQGYGQEPEWLAEELKQAGDRAGAISRTAMEGRCALAGQALELFVSLYGAEAGNLGLKFMATGGIYIGGGIAPKIVEPLRRGTFMAGFLNKGRMGEALRLIPVKVLLNDKTALLGAAYRGAQLEGAT